MPRVDAEPSEADGDASGGDVGGGGGLLSGIRRGVAAVASMLTGEYAGNEEEEEEEERAVSDRGNDGDLVEALMLKATQMIERRALIQAETAKRQQIIERLRTQYKGRKGRYPAADGRLLTKTRADLAHLARGTLPEEAAEARRKEGRSGA